LSIVKNICVCGGIGVGECEKQKKIEKEEIKRANSKTNRNEELTFLFSVSSCA